MFQIFDLYNYIIFLEKFYILYPLTRTCIGIYDRWASVDTCSIRFMLLRFGGSNWRLIPEIVLPACWPKKPASSKHVIAGLWTDQNWQLSHGRVIYKRMVHGGHFWMEHGNILLLSGFSIQVVGRILRGRQALMIQTICQMHLNIFHIFSAGAEWRARSRGVYLQCPCLRLYSFNWMFCVWRS